jgi:hypothetical protein
MPEPSYDFFATGRPAAPPGGAVPPLPGGHADQAATNPYAAPPAAVNQFGTPVAPQAPAFPVAPGSGYAPGAVNQFGTPLDVVPAPTGPFAAPGIAAAPVDAPGMVSTWGTPVPPRHASHAAAATSVVPLPRNVRAVAILALFFGTLVGIGTLWLLSQYSTLSAAVSSAAPSPELDDMVGAALTMVLIALVLLAAVTVFLLVGGVATLANRRWGGWMLVVAFGLYLLGQVRQLASTGPDTFSLIGAGIALALFLALVTGEGRQWLLRR